MPRKRNNSHQFPTNRDRDAFGEVLLRSDLSYAKGQFWRVEFIASPVDADCDQCRCGHANIRLIFNYGAHPYEADEYYQPAFGSDEYCLRCFKEAVSGWVEEMLDDITDSYVEYKSGPD